MLRTTLKDLLARKLRLLSTSVAVLLGVAFMAGTMVLTDTIGRTFDGLFADVYAGTDAVVRSTEELGGDPFSQRRATIDSALADRIAGLEGVSAVAASVQGYAQVVDQEGEALGNPNQGAPTFGEIWVEAPELNPFSLAAGRPPRGPGEAVLDKASADAAGYQVGDEAQVYTQQGLVTVTVVGIATFGEADSPLGASFVLFDQDTAMRLVGEPGRVSEIAVAAEPGISEADLISRIQAVIPATVEVVSGAAATAEGQDAIRQGLQFFNTFLLTFAAVALFVGAFIIYNTFSIIVAQRTRELALLRAVGASRRQVIGSVLIEAALVGLTASLLGLAAGVGVAAGLKALLAGFGFDIPAGGLAVLPRTIAVAVVVGVAVTVISAVFPARRAARVPPVAAMRDVAVDDTGRSRLRVAAGAGITVLGAAALAAGLLNATATLVGLGAAVVFVGVAVLGPVIAAPVSRLIGAPLPRLLGVTGALARQNATRNPKRTSATAAALMIGVGLVGFITVFASSAKAAVTDVIERSFTGDFVVDSGAWMAGGFTPHLVDELRALPEVGAAAGLRTATAEHDGSGEFLTGVDPGQLSRIVDLGVIAGSLGDLGAGEIAVSEARAESEDWTVGDTVVLRFLATGEQPLRVAAIYEENQVVGSLLLALPAFEANITDQFVSVILVDRASGVDAAAARAAIEEVVDRQPLGEVQDQTEFIATRTADINAMLNLIYALLALAVVIALIGIANTLALSIHERTRELGLLRAVGMTRRQLRQTVRWEAVIIALLGAVLGLAIGVFFGWAMVQALAEQGFDTLVIPFGSLLIIAVIAGLAGVVAALRPAWRASRLDVLGAIATE